MAGRDYCQLRTERRMLMEGCLPLREVRRVGSQANRIIGEHFVGRGHLHYILRTSLEPKRT